MVLVSRMAKGLLVLTLAGALASLFGPGERWWGIDIGSSGTVVFGFALWSGAWLFSKHQNDIFSESWSIAERRAWAALLFVGLIFFNFLRYMWALSLRDPPTSLGDVPATHFMWNLFVLLIAWAVVGKTIGGQDAGAVEFDERDQRIARAAHRAADWTLTIIAIVGIGLLVVLPAQRLSWWLAPLIAAHLMLGVLICKSLAEHLWLVMSYSRERH